MPSHLCRSLGLVAQNRPSWLWDTRAVAPVLVGRPLNLAWRHRSQSPETLHRLPHGLRQQNQDTKDLRQQYQALTNVPVSGACSGRPTLKEQQLSPPSTFYSLISLPIRILRDQIHSRVSHHATLPRRLRLALEWTCHFLQHVLPISLFPTQLGSCVKVLFHHHSHPPVFHKSINQSITQRCHFQPPTFILLLLFQPLQIQSLSAFPQTPMTSANTMNPCRGLLALPALNSQPSLFFWRYPVNLPPRTLLEKPVFTALMSFTELSSLSLSSQFTNAPHGGQLPHQMGAAQTFPIQHHPFFPLKHVF